MIRRVYVSVDEVRAENGRELEVPIRIAVAAAVIDNPFVGRYVEDLAPLTERYSARLADVLPPLAVDAVGGGASVEAYGKGGVVGLDGEVEHIGAIVHNFIFGTPFRELTGGTELISAVEKRGIAGTSVDIPLKHKLDMFTVTHHQTVEFRVPDAPLAREIVVFAAVSSGGRPLGRIADPGRGP